MTGSDGQKKETLAVVRGGRYAQRPMRVFTTLELRLDVEMQEVLGAVRGADGKPPTRGFQRVTYGEAFPWRVLARWFVQARRKNAPREQLKAIVARLDRFVDRLYTANSDRAA